MIVKRRFLLGVYFQNLKRFLSELVNVKMHTRQIGWDMGLEHYNETGSAEYQIPPETSTFI